MRGGISHEKQQSFGFRSFDPAPPLAARLLAVGRDTQTDVSYDWDGMKRGGGSRSFLFQYTLSGYGMLEMDGTVRRVPEGAAFMVRIPGEHRYFYHPDAGHWEFVWIMLDGDEAERLWPELLARLGPVPIFSPESEAVRLLLHIHQAAAEGRITDRFVGSGLAYRFLMELCRETEAARPAEAGLPEAVRRALDYLERHYMDMSGLDELAEQSGLSKYHLIRLFRQTRGATPLQHLTRLRLRRAAELLHGSGLSVGEIAARVGYANGNYLAKVFRRQLGMTPAEYRSRRKELPVDRWFLD